MPKTLSFFLGANTPDGFVSHFDSLLQWQEIKEVVILKGGAGCGKSTFMKAIGKAAIDCGSDIITFPCASDPESLDGILVCALGLVFLDGTAPHVVEPPLCGCHSTYLDFSQFYDHTALASSADVLKSLQILNRQCYDALYCYLQAAQALTRLPSSLTAPEQRADEIYTLVQSLIQIPSVPASGTRLPCFQEALTLHGYQSFASCTPQLCPKIFVLADQYFLGGRILHNLELQLRTAGQRLIVCADPLYPDYPLQLLLPEAGIALMRQTPLNQAPAHCFCQLDLTSLLTPLEVQQLEEIWPESAALLEQYLAKSQQLLLQAKAYHDEMEAIYKLHTDYAAVSEMTQQSCKKLASTLSKAQVNC